MKKRRFSVEQITAVLQQADQDWRGKGEGTSGQKRPNLSVGPLAAVTHVLPTRPRSVGPIDEKW